MKKSDGLKYKKRSELRLKCGVAFYTMRRYLLWMSGKYRFASTKNEKKLPEVQFSHRTVLLRKLRDVDMRYQYNKIQNLKLAVHRIDKILLLPGQTFSYWKLIGRPSYRKGYLDGIVLHAGKVGKGCGGGLCQLSNLIFWMTLHTPLEVMERHRHGYDVFPDSDRTQPFGSGATCFYPHGDLMIYNPTDEPYQLCLRVGEKYLEGEWRSTAPLRYIYRIVERNHEMRSEWWGGFSRHNELYRQTLTSQGELVEEYLAVENHALMMYSPFLSEKAETADGAGRS